MRSRARVRTFRAERSTYDHAWPGRGKPVPIAGIPQTVPILPILNEPPPVATTAADALTQVPQLDDFNPRETRALSWLPRTSDGGFALSPGAYAWTVQSYCLNVGAHAPGGDAAYLLAPLRGSRAAVVSDVVQHAASHPEIPQQTVQLLLWTITSRARIADTNAAVRAAADVLLSAANSHYVNAANAQQMNGNGYEDLVLEALNAKLAAGGAGDAGGPSGESRTGAVTDGTTCAIEVYVTLDEVPAAIYNAILTHEGVHASTCKKLTPDQRAASDTPAATSADEVAAYSASLDYMRRWYASHCN